MIKLLFVVLLVAGAELRAEVLLATSDYAPLVFHKDGKAAGIGVDIGREMGKRAGINLKDLLITAKRFSEVTQNYEALFASVSRTPERESQFRWIGKILEDNICFVNLTKNPPINSLEDAKKLKKVGVTDNGASEPILRKEGFANIELASGAAAHARKLIAGRIDAWFTSQIVSLYHMKESKIDPNLIRCSLPQPRPANWVATSLKVPDALYKKLKSTFDDLEKEGFVKKTVDSYIK